MYKKLLGGKIYVETQDWDHKFQQHLRGLFREEPYQDSEPHWDVFILNNDLNAYGADGRYINFVFGETDTSFASSVQSVTRLIAEMPSGPVRRAMVRRLLRHEVGHMFQLPSLDRMREGRNVEEKLGRHCTNLCTMRQGMSILEWKQLTLQEEGARVHFCRDCQHDLAQARNRYRPLPR